MKYRVGDRVRCVSKDENAPVGIVGTIVRTERQVFFDPHSIGVYTFDYTVKYDEGQNERIDREFPDGTPENAEDLELIQE